MNNIVGQPVSGSDFFERNTIINLIYRRLGVGSNLFMAAPRRVGKTSIMFNLRDNPRPGFAFIYVPTESINNTELFFKRLFEELLNSEVVRNTVKASEISKGIFETITNKVKKIGAFGIELELQSTPVEKYSTIFLELMKKLKNEKTRIVIMIDEFPSTIENINQKEGTTEAVHFLKLNRTIRQESAGGIQFIYTGSIGLPAIVNRLNTPESINDLNQVEILPLSIEVDAPLFAKQLLNTAKVPYQPEAIDYLLNKIKWLMPFFIQLSIQELVDLFDQKGEEITPQLVDLAFENICNRRNNIHFDSYYNRLKDTFSKEDYKLALKTLNLIASKEEIENSELTNEFAPKQEDNLVSIISSLEYDGYINLTKGNYSFNSPILKLWWTKYVRIK